MSWWSSIVCLLAIVGTSIALYALHRLFLWLEDAGYMYYLRKKPSGSGGFSSLVELQKALEPTTRYVAEAKEERIVNIEDSSGESTPPRLKLLPTDDDPLKVGPV